MAIVKLDRERPALALLLLAFLLLSGWILAQPHDLTGIPGGDDIQYVLEINGGMAETLGIAPGAELRHPSIDNGAWPCEESDSAG